MDAIARRELLDSFARFDGNAPHACSTRSARARALTSVANSDKSNIFQRTLLWIKGLVQSRAKAISLNRALFPFIKHAKQKSTCLIPDDQFKNLASALARPVECKQHAAGLVAEVVRDNVKTLNLVELKRLQALVRERPSPGEPLEQILLIEVDNCVIEAKAKEAKRNLSEALDIFSRLSAESFDADFVVSAMHHNLQTINDLAQPVVTNKALNTWYEGHSTAQKKRVKLNLWSVAMDSSLAHSESQSDKQMYSFCNSATKSLWPDDMRHTILYNLPDTKTTFNN